jgi:uncharacterized membrane protein
MHLKPFYKYVSPILVIAAVILIIVAIAEAGIQLFGYSLISSYYSPGRIMELSAIFLLLVVVQMLHQIRDTLRMR